MGPLSLVPVFGLALLVFWIITRSRISPAAVTGLPLVRSYLPWVGSGVAFVRNPCLFLQRMRNEKGDTFLLDMFGVRFLFTFSPAGLEALYNIREHDASFTEATRGLLGLKLPGEVLTGSMTMFHKRLRKSLLPDYVQEMNRAVERQLASLGQEGTFEVFSFFKQLVHQVGISVWMGPKAAQSNYLQRFVSAFEALDVEQGFQNLSSLFVTLLTSKYYEKRALADLEQVVTELWQHQMKNSDEVEADANLSSLHDLYKDLPEDKRHRQVAIDIFQFHLASQANTYASLSWMLAILLNHPQHFETVKKELEEAAEQHGPDFMYSLTALDQLSFIESVVQESLRLAQKSITLRKVMRPCQFLGQTLPKGLYLATLLSITNNEVGAGELPADHFDPQRLSMATQANQYSISTFGHGFHACPGLKFAMALHKVVLAQLFVGQHSLQLKPCFSYPIKIPKETVGAVARAANPCYVQYKLVGQNI